MVIDLLFRGMYLYLMRLMELVQVCTDNDNYKSKTRAKTFISLKMQLKRSLTQDVIPCDAKDHQNNSERDLFTYLNVSRTRRS